MVRQELQQANETVAARDAQVADMESRIAELEQLQVDQQKLLTMKDSELTAVQEQLAQNQAAETGGDVSGWPWIFAGIGLLALVLLGGWWLRRRPDAAPKFRAPTISATTPSALVGGFPANRTASRPGIAPEAPEGTGGELPIDSESAPAPESEITLTSPITPSVEATSAGATRSREAQPEAARTDDLSLIAGQAAVPVWHAGAGDQKMNRPPPVTTTETDFDVETPGLERLELARAYLELGDRDSARQLLGELVLGGDLGTRQEAERLLREIG